MSAWVFNNAGDINIGTHWVSVGSERVARELVWAHNEALAAAAPDLGTTEPKAKDRT